MTENGCVLTCGLVYHSNALVINNNNNNY